MNCSEPRFEVNRIKVGQTVKSFDCGDEDLNNFILKDAPLFYKVRLSTTYVLEDSETAEVLGYFSLANDRISLTDFPSNSSYNRFRKQYFAQGKMFRSYPAVKICRLATSITQAGCRFITVDAYANAIPFYLNLGFLPLSKEDEGAETRLLYFDLKQLEI